jgi:hypothetical protein
MDFLFSFNIGGALHHCVNRASAVEAWHSVPLISFYLPFTGAVFSVNNWLAAVALAV